eukprot:gene25491-11147_t
MSGYAAAPLSDVQDINTLLYLNPELSAYSNVRTIEDALVHFDAYSNLPNVMPTLPVGFDAKVYIGAQSARGVFVATLMCGAKVRTLYQAGSNFPYSINLEADFTSNDLQPDDRIRLVQHDNGFIVEAAVLEVSYERSRILLAPSTNPRVRAALASTSGSFEAFGIRIYDPLRQARVSFARTAMQSGGVFPSGPDAVPAKEFVYDMYQLMYPETRGLGFSDTYLDYRRKWERVDAYRIRGPSDLLNIQNPNASGLIAGGGGSNVMGVVQSSGNISVLDTLTVGYGDFSWMSPSNVSLAEGYVRISTDSFAAGFESSNNLYATGQYASLCSNLVVGFDSATVRSDMECMGALTIGATSFNGGVATLGGGALIVEEGDAGYGSPELKVTVQVRDMMHIGETLGIGTSNPDPTLTNVCLVGGDIFATGTVVTLSDRDAKTDVVVIEDPLHRVRGMRGCTFFMKDSISDDGSDKRRQHTGLIAQEVQEILPEAVYRTPCGSLSVAYGNLAGLLVESIKELVDRLEHLSGSRRAVVDAPVRTAGARPHVKAASSSKRSVRSAAAAPGLSPTVRSGPTASLAANRGSVITAAVAGAKPYASVMSKLEGTADVVQVYRYPGITESKATTLLRKAKSKASADIISIDCEQVFNVGLAAALTSEEAEILAWSINSSPNPNAEPGLNPAATRTYAPEQLTPSSRFNDNGTNYVVEVGPRSTFSTAFSTNAISICGSCGLSKVNRLEMSRRYYLNSSTPLSEEDKKAFAALVHDRMTEEMYKGPVSSFAIDATPAPVFFIPVMAQGKQALIDVNEEMGLAFDEWDIDFYLHLFQDDMKRDPSNVELFDMAQSNSEHSRHWFFDGKIVIDGEEMPTSLFKLVKYPYEQNPNNSVVAFKDNSSAIRGFKCNPLLPAVPGNPSPLMPQARDWDLLLTAETHNFPCAVAPLPGAETGTGGRIRDTHATGKGSMMGGATAGYCVGNLQMEGYEQPFEDKEFVYPASLASPLQILIDASNGASDYGNKFGEPLIAGYTRSFGQRLPNGERREWIKPIMFSGGVGQIDHSHLKKDAPEISMLVVKIGGPAYRIGMGGGAASSIPSGGGRADLDFNAVQRGDAEMSQKLWRVVRSCCELGENNPIVQIHDQGAGGNCNVVKEIIYPLGAEIDIRAVKVGDETLSVLEIWGAEYQENDALLIKPEQREAMQAICDRERCLMQVIGTIDGSGRVTVVDKNAPPGTPPAVDLDLEKVLGKLPPKTFSYDRSVNTLAPLMVPSGTTPMSALDLILRLPSVCSKRFLTTKVDRHVTGLVAQQQCVGPLQIPLSDVAVYAQSHQDFTGLATSIGEQPLKGLIDPAAMARLSLGESLTNLVWAKATSLPDVRASVNWMYAAKMKSEGAAMYDAGQSICDAMVFLGMAIDGGKDSLSMAANAGDETVMAPGNLVVSCYVGVPDITKVVTPDLKLGDAGVLVHVDLANGARRMGGSALAQVYSQLGNVSPDVTAEMLKGMWEVTQELVDAEKISAGHDISDGGIATALLEMAFAGNCGISADLPAATNTDEPVLAALFAEELGLVMEMTAENAEVAVAAYKAAGVPASIIGKSSSAMACSISVAGKPEITGECPALRDVWEATAFNLERLQAAEECVAEEEAGMKFRKAPKWTLPFKPAFTPEEKMMATDKVSIAIIREEGSNGDREMSAACFAAGMEPWDVTMSDLLNGRASLDTFRGIIFVGGFSYADTLDSAKGWAGTIRFNEKVLSQFQEFYNRQDTWSLGVCNGCQLMALLGWVPASGTNGSTTGGPEAILPDLEQPRFVHNSSGRFESRYVMVNIAEDTPSVLLKNMGGATIGVWAAHGEGQALFPNEDIKNHVLDKNLAPIRYVDNDGNTTQAYPFNPNGSPLGIAALSSENGRHLAMMPHPERCFLTWQLPYHPKDLGLEPKGPAPWIKLFQNAREWCEAYDAKN